MANPEIPSTPDQLTVKLLNGVLRKSGRWHLGPFDSIKVSTPHGAADGMSNSVHQIDGKLKSGKTIRLIVKLSDAGGSTGAQRGDQHEVFFYRELAEIAGVSSPVAYAAEFDEVTQRKMIVLEHLGADGEIGSIHTYLNVSEIERIVIALAGMHSKWWNTDGLSSLTNVRTFEDAIAGGAEQFASGHYSGKRFIDKYGEHLDPEIREIYAAPNPWNTRLISAFSGNRTLCNYDVAPKNLFLPHDPTVPPKFFDWSLLTRGSIGIELAVVLAYSLRVEDHGKFEQILETYLKTMRDLGVTALSWNTLWNDFRRGLLIRLAAPIALTSRDYQPAHELALELLPRISSAVLVSGAKEIVEIQ